MADLFFVSLEACSLSFVPPHYLFSLRRPPSRFFAHKLQLKKPDNSAGSADLGILSSTERSDGSVVFRFGDVEEIAGEALLESESITDVNSAEISDGGCELVDDVKEKVDNKPREEIESAVRRKQRPQNVKVSVLLEKAAPMRTSKEDSSQPIVEEETSCVNMEDHEPGKVKVGVSNSAYPYKEGSASDEERVVEGVAAFQDSSNAELVDLPSSSLSGSQVEDLNVDHQHLSVASRGCEGDGSSNIVREDNNYDDYVGGVMDLPVESKVDSNSGKGSTTDTADGSVSEHVTETADVSDGNSVSSFCKDAGTDSALGTSDSVTVSVHDQLELEMLGTTLERDEISPTGYHLSSAAAFLPHPFKAFAGREDACFITQNWVGVADGIGLWSFEGTTSPGQYARELMENCQKVVSCSNLSQAIDPVEVLHRSAMETQSLGASTVLLAFFDGQALHVANIGDSAFIVIRDGMVFKRSCPMFHQFSFPIRLQKGDYPLEFAEVYKTDLDEGDCIVIASDGLFDNLHELEIASIVARSLQDLLKPQEIAELLATRAQEVGQSTTARTPYSDAAQAAGYKGY